MNVSLHKVRHRRDRLGTRPACIASKNGIIRGRVIWTSRRRQTQPGRRGPPHENLYPRPQSAHSTIHLRQKSTPHQKRRPATHSTTSPHPSASTDTTRPTLEPPTRRSTAFPSLPPPKSPRDRSYHPMEDSSRRRVNSPRDRRVSGRRGRRGGSIAVDDALTDRGGGDSTGAVTALPRGEVSEGGRRRRRPCGPCVAPRAASTHPASGVTGDSPDTNGTVTAGAATPTWAPPPVPPLPSPLPHPLSTNVSASVSAPTLPLPSLGGSPSPTLLVLPPMPPPPPQSVAQAGAQGAPAAHNAGRNGTATGADAGGGRGRGGGSEDADIVGMGDATMTPAGDGGWPRIEK